MKYTDGKALDALRLNQVKKSIIEDGIVNPSAIVITNGVCISGRYLLKAIISLGDLEKIRFRLDGDSFIGEHK